MKFDIVIEAVHYSADGLIDWVRIYERRGPIFSDRVIIKRDELIKRLEDGLQIVIGKRIKFKGATFETGQSVRLEAVGQKSILLTEGSRSENDLLEGVPQI